MPQITNAKIKQLTDSLAISVFTECAFLKEFPDNEQAVVRFTFIDNTAYSYEMSFAASYEKHSFEVSIIPGAIRKGELYKLTDFSDCIEVLRNWLVLLKDELKATSYAYNEIEKLKIEFAEKLNETFKDQPSSNFSESEIERIEDKLDTIYREVEELKSEKSLTDKELETLRSELENLKDNIRQMPKRTWLRSAGSKLIEISMKFLSTDSGQRLVEETVDKLLQPPS